MEVLEIEPATANEDFSTIQYCSFFPLIDFHFLSAKFPLSCASSSVRSLLAILLFTPSNHSSLYYFFYSQHFTLSSRNSFPYHPLHLPDSSQSLPFAKKKERKESSALSLTHSLARPMYWENKCVVNSSQESHQSTTLL
jgi:hypothetical protein